MGQAVPSIQLVYVCSGVVYRACRSVSTAGFRGAILHPRQFYGGLDIADYYPAGCASESRYNYSLSWILWLYLLVGIFHFGWIAYKEAVRRPVHSFSAGRSWLLPVGKFFLEVANDFLSFLIHGIIRFVPAHERAILLNSRPLLRDIRTFTERYIEPVVLLIAALIFAALGMAGIFGWLMFSMGALIIFTGIRHQTERNYILDIRDMKIEADYMRSLIAGEPQPYADEPIQMRQVIQEAAREAENSPETVEVLEQKQPTLADAIKAMNARRNKPPQEETPPPVSTV